MIPLEPVDLPAVSLLPSTDVDFVQAMDDVTLLAGGLMVAVDATLLTIAVPSDRWGADVPLMMWNERLAGCPTRVRTLIDNPLFDAPFDALCMATDALFARLETWRWTDVDAPGLCLVTDGVGVVLSPERPPADAGADWLLELARSGAATVVRPPEADGAWSLITAETETIH